MALSHVTSNSIMKSLPSISHSANAIHENEPLSFNISNSVLNPLTKKRNFLNNYFFNNANVRYSSLQSMFFEKSLHTFSFNNQKKVTKFPKIENALAPPYNVVVTGSTKGVGLELAHEFLQAGDRVVVCSRSGERVEKVVNEFNKKFNGRIWGIPCNVSKAEEVAAMAKFASEKMGTIDIWINNAGSNAYSFAPLIETDENSIIEIVETNTLGVMLCCREAIKVMRAQKNGGHVFNMDGAGADGNATPRFAAYGATKRSLAQFTKSIQSELKTLNIKNVVVHNLSPGMVTTELLMAGGNTPTARFFINALAEPATDVAQFLVPRVRDVLTSQTKSKSTYIKFLTPAKAYSQIFARILFKARKDRYLSEE